MKKTFLEASKTAEQDINAVSYAGQNPKHKQYRSGYEQYMEMIPVLEDNDPMLEGKVKIASEVMSQLGEHLRKESWIAEQNLQAGDFTRNIIAVERPLIDWDVEPPVVQKEGKELLIASWGDGKESPVHGHSAGYLHEEILFGKMLVNQYRMTAPDSNVVRLVRTDIHEAGTFASVYTKDNPENHFKRQGFIHNFRSLGFSASLHYVPEHTRDGRDNKFEVEYFEEKYRLAKEDVRRIDSKEGLYLRKGDVVLVRSENVPEYGDHYIVITGHPVVKSHGLRPQEVTVSAPKASALLNKFPLQTGLTLLKLNDSVRDLFLKFHGITLDKKGDVIFPNA